MSTGSHPKVFNLKNSEHDTEKGIHRIYSGWTTCTSKKKQRCAETVGDNIEECEAELRAMNIQQIVHIWCVRWSGKWQGLFYCNTDPKAISELPTISRPSKSISHHTRKDNSCENAHTCLWIFFWGFQRLPAGTGSHSMGGSRVVGKSVCWWVGGSKFVGFLVSWFIGVMAP